MTYEQAINYLYSLERFGIKFGLRNIRYLLSLLNNPQESFKNIHIAGTNGKGSTSAFISSILKESGYKIGLYTSPHLSDFSERIQVNSILIPRERLTSILKKLMPLIKKVAKTSSYGHPTYFEVSTAIAFEYFREEKIDIACIEVGMGGRLDATNILKNPLVSVITSIGLEHTKELGETLDKIAFEKAGIIKKNGILVCGVNEKEPLDRIKKICQKQNAKIYAINKDFTGAIRQVSLTGQKFSYKGIWNNQPLVEISLLGKHQIQNASLSMAVIECLKFYYKIDIKTKAIIKGLKNARWPGRFEIIRKDSDNIGANTIIIDGAHNPPGIMKLVESLEEIFPNRKINFVLGILKDKDVAGMIKIIIPIANKIIATAPRCDRACSPDKLAGIIKGLGKEVELICPISNAIKKIKEKSAGNEIFCITGSLYTVGEAREILKIRNSKHEVRNNI